ncbi:hypothetical protein ABC304_03480 [Microbacterium sp. 1P10UB]|uniref:hypothetical protein n=1 Tax=unclassified Microbacterium TaxID=2609290 RepID=UPI0039A3B848
MSIKPVMRELRQAVLDGMRHTDLKLSQLTTNLDDHLDSIVRAMRDVDTFDADSVSDATARGWLGDIIARRGRKTDAGWHFLPKGDRDAASHVPIYPGEYALDLHGSPQQVQGGDGTMMDAATFADVVRRRTDWDGQTPIRLFSCDTGADPDGFAQQLSNNLGVDVTAPTKPVWSQPNGAPFVTDIDPVTGAPAWPPNGAWVQFSPKE